MISIVILGAGNVATHLYKAFKNAKDTSVIQWYSRSISKVQSYKNEVDTTDDLNTINTNADLYIIAVSDDAIGSLSSQLDLENKLVVHTSGSVSLHDLDKKHQRGVFYPLQSFSKTLDLDFSKVPICIETERKEHTPLLKNLAEALGCNHYKVNSDQRSALHLAAVFVNNFTNQLYRIGHEITESKSVNFDILKPLIQETARKIEALSPYMAQTGPAKRNDKKTIKKHLKALEKDIHTEVYELMTKSIKSTHGNWANSSSKKR